MFITIAATMLAWLDLLGMAALAERLINYKVRTLHYIYIE